MEPLSVDALKLIDLLSKSRSNIYKPIEELPIHLRRTTLIVTLYGDGLVAVFREGIVSGSYEDPRLEDELGRHAPTWGMVPVTREVDRLLDGDRNALLRDPLYLQITEGGRIRLAKERDRHPIVKAATAEAAILSALFEAKAFGADSLVSAAKLKVKVRGVVRAVSTTKTILQEMKKDGLVDAIGGRSGGYWLTASGRSEARRWPL